jgi:hypothetical protein
MMFCPGTHLEAGGTDRGRADICQNCGKVGTGLSVGSVCGPNARAFRA